MLAVLWLAAGCTWVKLQPEGVAVQAIDAGTPPPANCTQRGEIEVSVADRVGFIDRKDKKVALELEKLARNEAGLMGAEAIQPLAPPAGGRQRFAAFDCPPPAAAAER